MSARNDPTFKRLRANEPGSAASPTGNGPKPVKKPPAPQVVTSLHTDNLATRVWLVKVPKSVDDAWQRDRKANVKAKLIINQADTPTPSVLLELPPEPPLAKPPPVQTGRRSNVSQQPPVHVAPKRYELKMMSLEDQDMTFYKQSRVPGEGEILVSGTADQPAVEVPKLDMELLGIVDKRFDASIIMDSNYLESRKVGEATQKKQSLTIQLDKAMDRYMPGAKSVASMYVNSKGITAGGKLGSAAPARSAKQEREERYLNKNVAGNRDEVRNTLFMAFTDHDYYQLTDLQKLTKQPVGFLKQVLEEIAVKETGTLHRGAYRLKDEYRPSARPPADA